MYVHFKTLVSIFGMVFCLTLRLSQPGHVAVVESDREICCWSKGDDCIKYYKSQSGIFKRKFKALLKGVLQKDGNCRCQFVKYFN